MKLLKFLAELLKALAAASHQSQITNHPSPVWYVMRADDALRDFRANDIEDFGPRDTWYWFVDTEIWGDWWFESFENTPDYRSITKDHRGFDCDKFARCFACFVNKRGANACWEVWGITPQGLHAWNVIQTPQGKLELEPQNGMAWELGSNPDYKIKYRL